MRWIKLTRGKRCKVDDDLFDFLNQWKWYFSGNYAVRGVRRKSVKNGYITIMMHNSINNTPQGFETDHINRDKLDNRRENLRSATRAENRYNMELRADNKSGQRGVSWYKQTNRWVARGSVNGKLTTLGYFKDIKDAIHCRLQHEQVVGANIYTK